MEKLTGDGHPHDHLHGVLGQQKKILKEESVKKLFDLYGVEYE